MTERLYYRDAYQREFAAAVLSCQPAGDRWEVVLDRTAFYPEGGGQNPDTGTLGQARVLDTQERGDQVVHTTDRPLEPGAQVAGRIDWPQRFSRMQHHTGEHLLSGTLHRLYGVDNVGFHMGHDAVTLDLSAELDAAQLERAEQLVNEAMGRGGYDNVTVIVVDVTGLAEQHRRKLTRKSRATAIMLALLLVAIIAGCAYGFNYLASNAAYLVAQDGKVAVYQGVPGDIFGFSFNHLDRVTDVALDDLQPGTANRLSEEGIKVDSLEAANSLVAEYEKEIADRKAAEEEAARAAAEANQPEEPAKGAEGAGGSTASGAQGGTDAQGTTGGSQSASPSSGAGSGTSDASSGNTGAGTSRDAQGGAAGGTNR